jgi:hypothetical protein
MAANVTFNGNAKLIIVDYGITSIEAQLVYSAWKQWVKLGNANFLEAFRTIGGDPTVSPNSVAGYYFLVNGWRLRPYEGNHIKC